MISDIPTHNRSSATQRGKVDKSQAPVISSAPLSSFFWMVSNVQYKHMGNSRYTVKSIRLFSLSCFVTGNRERCGVRKQNRIGRSGIHSVRFFIPRNEGGLVNLPQNFALWVLQQNAGHCPETDLPYRKTDS